MRESCPEFRPSQDNCYHARTDPTTQIVGGSRTTPGKFGARFAKLTVRKDKGAKAVLCEMWLLASP